MKKIIILAFSFTLSIASLDAFAQSADEELLKAVASCNNPNNPLLNGLYAVKGNSFSRTKVEYHETLNDLRNVKEISTFATLNPRIYNSAIGAPVVNLAEIKIIVGRKSLGVGDTEVCELTVTKLK